MMDRGIEPNVISYNSAISACEKGKQWEEALRLLQEMTDRGIEPDMFSYKSTIEACFIPGKYLNALSLVRQARKSGIFPIFATRNAPVWDLRGCVLSVGCMLIADSLLEVLKQEATSQELSFEPIVVVTGKDLRFGVPHFLRKTSGPDISPKEKNEAAFLLTRMSFRKWMDSDAVQNFKSRFTREVGRRSLTD